MFSQNPYQQSIMEYIFDLSSKHKIFHTQKCARTLTSNVFLISSVLSERKLLPCRIPALFTRISTGPISLDTFIAIQATSSSFLQSQQYASASDFIDRTILAVLSADSKKQ